jgi:phospholipid/cholesterol/gamma-HCH transport system substrate-binding protein
VSDYETIQRKRNITVGIFVVAGIFALVWLIYRFGDLPITVSKIRSFEVLVQFPTAPGVQKDTPVSFCGYQVGRVTKIQHPKVLEDLNTHKFYHQTLVVLSINKKYNDIPADVQAKLITRGLGSSYIELKLKRFDVNEPTGPFLTKGSLLQGSTGVASEFFPEESQEKLDELVDGLKTLINNTNNIVGDPNNKENLKKSLANLAETSQKATKTIEEIDELVASMIGTSEELSETTAQFRLILEKVNNGQGTAAKFLNDGRFYENMLENTQQMQILLEELKLFVSEAREKGLPIKMK